MRSVSRHMYTLILLALSLSLDAAAVGFSYGIKKIRLPLSSLAVIFIISALMSAAGTFFGNALSQFLPENISRIISFLMLSLLGIWMIADSFSDFSPHKKNALSEKTEKALSAERTFEFDLRSIYLSVKIIKRPVNCDFDRSLNIDFFESVYLAFMLSLDSVCSCIGFGTSGAAPYTVPLLVGIFQVLLLYTGTMLGKHFSRIKIFSSRISALTPGLILLAVAVMHFFQQ